MIGELAVRAFALAVAVPHGNLGGPVAGEASLPGAAPVAGPAHVERDLEWRCEVERLAGEVRRPVRAEGDVRIAGGIVDTGPGHARVVRVLRQSRNEAAWQRGRPGLAAVEARVHRAAIVVVPVIGAGDQVVWVGRVDRQRSFVLRGLVTRDVDDLGRAQIVAAGDEIGRSIAAAGRERAEGARECESVHGVCSGSRSRALDHGSSPAGNQAEHLTGPLFSGRANRSSAKALLPEAPRAGAAGPARTAACRPRCGIVPVRCCLPRWPWQADLEHISYSACDFLRLSPGFFPAC